MSLRTAHLADIAALKSIMDQVISVSTSSFSTQKRSAEDWEELIVSRQEKGRAFYVAEVDGDVIGYASYDQFSPDNNGYRHTMEHSVFLSDAAQGQGLGRMLMLAIEEHARSAGHHSMIAKISGDNNGSIVFHEKLGFEVVGRLREAGHKFDAWLDVVLMQKML